MRVFLTLITYALVALGTLIGASWVASVFLPKAFSQAGNPPANNPAPSNPNNPPAGAPAVNQVPPPPEGQPPAVSQGIPPAQAAPHPDISGKNLLANVIEDYNYEPKGQRDPFTPFMAPIQTNSVTTGPFFPLQKFDLDQLKLIGVIWDNRTPKAMVLDPAGKGYVVRTNEKIGRNNGYIAKIREGELVIVESFTGNDGKVSYQTKLMKLTPE